MTRPRKVLLLGDVNLDFLFEVAAQPPAGGDAIARNLQISPGGSSANTAIILSRLGIKTEIIACCGQDPWADMLLKTFRNEKVGTRFLSRDLQNKTGMIFIAVDGTGERSMYSNRGANVFLDPAGIQPGMFSACNALHLSGYAFLQPPQKDAAWRALDLAAVRKIPVSIDLGVGAAAPEILAGGLLARLDLIILSEEELRSLAPGKTTAGAMHTLLDRGVKRIGLKLGKEGCLLAEGEDRARVPGFPVRALDATGAGDAFSAGMIYAGQKGLSLEAGGRLASALGALAATVRGGGSSFPPLERLNAFLLQQKRDERLEEIFAALGFA